MKRKKSPEPASRGLTPKQAVGGAPPAKMEALAASVGTDGGTVIGTYRDPLGGNWQLLVVLPVEKVQPTPYQRDLSEAHVERLGKCIDTLDRYLDPIIVVRRDDGVYWTPNGHHRLAAVRWLGGRSITALLIPEPDMAYKILALNTEKAHNLREKSLEVIRMARELAGIGQGTEIEFEPIFEDPVLLTLGACYEKKGRFAGSAYQPVLKRVEAFLRHKIAGALQIREARAGQLFELDEAVAAAIQQLKDRGFESPYLRNFVVARINPLRFQRGKKAEFDETIDKMLRSAQRFNPEKVSADQLAGAGGAPEE